MQQTDRQMFDSQGNTSNLQLLPNFYMTRKGELYRIATVMSFDLAARQANEKKKHYYGSHSIGGKCPLYGTYFKAFDFGGNKYEPLELRVLIFECTSDEN